MESQGTNSPSVGRIGKPDVAAPSPVAVFDLESEVQSLAAASDPERTARTLARLETLRLTLMRLKSGSTVKEHRTDHQISIHTVSGHVVLHTERERLDLPAGRVAVLESGVVHDIAARQDSAILITVCVSGGQGGEA